MKQMRRTYQIKGRWSFLAAVRRPEKSFREDASRPETRSEHRAPYRRRQP